MEMEETKGSEVPSLADIGKLGDKVSRYREEREFSACGGRGISTWNVDQEVETEVENLDRKSGQVVLT